MNQAKATILPIAFLHLKYPHNHIGGLAYACIVDEVENCDKCVVLSDI
jgi:hypothetical protein